MSTYWGYKCIDCNEESDHWLSHGEDTLREVYNLYIILDLKKYENRLVRVTLQFHLSRYFTAEIMAFLSEHSSHNMVLHSEYGKELTLDNAPESMIC